MPRTSPLVVFALAGISFFVAAACSGTGSQAPIAVVELDGGTDGGTEAGGRIDGGPVSTAGVVTCNRALPEVLPGETCVSGTGGSGSVVILRGDVLGPTDVFENGEVVFDDAGRITCAGCDCSSVPGYATAKIVACAGSAISPGLINPHDHITFANNAPVPHGTERYDHRHEWRRGKNGHTKLTTAGSAPGDAITGHELRMLISGVTSIAGAGSRYGLLRNLDQSDLRVLEGLGARESDSDTFPLDDSGGTQLTTGCAYGQARTTEVAVAGKPSYVPHISEGIDNSARNEFLCASESDAANGKQQLLTAHTAVVHAVAVTAADAKKIRDSGATVVWSPRSNIDLYGNTAPVTLLDTMGVTLALGTDWVPSGSMNMLRELRCADSLNTLYYGKHFSDYSIWRMSTYGGARATRAETVVGALKPGYMADIVIFRGRDGARHHRAVIAAGVEDVALVLRGGQAMYGDRSIMDGLGSAACEPMDVCSVGKKACVQRETGKDAATIRAAIEAFYPLYFCRDAVPTREPSCTPYRATYPAGITAADSDGDGMTNETDICPTTFDPIRPLDGAKQADGDGDGKGDACDPCPLDSGNACGILSAADRDSDGVRDEVDVCPDVADAAQSDLDGDGRGDACDSCTSSNPGAVACLTTVEALADVQSPARPPLGAIVRIESAEVIQFLSTAGYQRGFVAKGASAQIQVRTGSATPTVTMGQRVAAIEGVYDDRASTASDSAALRIRVTRIIP